MILINFFISLFILSLCLFAIIETLKNLCHSKNINDLILKEIKGIYSKLDI